MQTPDNAQAKRSGGPGFIGYASQRLILALVLIGIVVGGTAYLLNHFDIAPAQMPGPDANQQSEKLSQPFTSNEELQATEDHIDPNNGETATQSIQAPSEHPQEAATDTSVAVLVPRPAQQMPSVVDEPSIEERLSNPRPPIEDKPAPVAEPAPAPETGIVTGIEPAQAAEPQGVDPTPPSKEVLSPRQPLTPPTQNDRQSTTVVQPDRHLAPSLEAQQAPPLEPKQAQRVRPVGVAFVEAVIQPIEHELNQRILGWQPNDIINFADNTKNYQLGVIEVTRRTMVQLAERLSRKDNTDAYNQHLQNAMNGFMVKADRYWFPSPESKYKESLKALEDYKQALMNGAASIHTRSDNLIPLLKAYEKLLVSCDENLVKRTETDGSKVSMFKTDNYFYYAKGVTSALGVMLEAIGHDFAQTLKKHSGSELLHHAVASCHIAANLKPWFITDSDLDGFFANHRSNLAAPISHARSYIAQLIKTLSA